MVCWLVKFLFTRKFYEPKNKNLGDNILCLNSWTLFALLMQLNLSKLTVHVPLSSLCLCHTFINDSTIYPPATQRKISDQRRIAM
uniref:Uncharacterized protein n=1 Tax=Rhizophora mucronata TaxID=61149 RepID=A0A2P2IMR6_RHIMU